MLHRIKKHKNRMQDALLLGLLSLPGASHAATIETILNQAAGYLQGNLARAVGLIAIVGSGYLCIFKQQLPKEQFTYILVGLGIIFGAASLYSTIVA